MRKTSSSASERKGDATQRRGLLRRFARDRQGAGAVEFAIIAPLLVVAYIGAFEVSVGFGMASKVSRAASTVSDLLTQESTTTADTVDTMKEVTKRVLAPFQQTDGYTLKITGVAVGPDGKATVAWSRDQEKKEPYPKGSAVTLPSNIEGAKNLFFVRTELSVPYTILLMSPNLSHSLNTFPIAKTSYFGLRQGKEIACSGC